jgi:hypothetical protein
MNRTWMVALIGVTVLGLAAVVAAAGKATAAGGPPSIAAGPAFGFVPSRNANHGGGHGGHVVNLTWHGGPVMHGTTVINPVFWGSAWSSSTFTGDKQTGLDTLYSNMGNTPYARTNGEYTDSVGAVDTTGIGWGADLTDPTSTPSGAPTTDQVLAAVARATNNNPTAGAYYPV